MCIVGRQFAHVQESEDHHRSPRAVGTVGSKPSLMGTNTTLGYSARLEAPNYIFPGIPIAKFQHEGALHNI